MKTRSVTASVLMLAFLLLNVQFVAGQDPAPVAPQATDFTRAPGALPIQGRLTNASGVPLNGTFSMVFSLYEVETGGTPYCSDTQSVAVSNGLFSSYLDGCYYQGSAGPNYIYGQKLWLGVKVGSDPEMTPRQVILPVPYALTLSPGAYVRGNENVDEVLNIEAIASSANGDWDALIAKAAGSGEAVEATAADGFAVYGLSATSISIYGSSPDTSTVPAIFGCKGTPCEYENSPTGVRGKSSAGDGVQGISTAANGRGLYASNLTNIAILGYNNVADTTNHRKPTLYLVQGDSTGDFVVGANGYLGPTRDFRIDGTGRGFFNGGTQTGGADFAEQVAAEGPSAEYEPGDVLVISTSLDRSAALSSEPYSTLVLGVYSTQPGYLAGAPDTDDPLAGLPVAVVGIVPCKVSTENGPIQRGDLLVTSSTPGYAMRAGANPPVGTVLGKAMEPLAEDTGLIQVLVTLQ